VVAVESVSDSEYVRMGVNNRPCGFPYMTPFLIVIGSVSNLDRLRVYISSAGKYIDGKSFDKKYRLPYTGDAQCENPRNSEYNF
jgi:hypothetical protein